MRNVNYLTVNLAIRDNDKVNIDVYSETEEFVSKVGSMLCFNRKIA